MSDKPQEQPKPAKQGDYKNNSSPKHPGMTPDKERPKAPVPVKPEKG